MGNLKSKKIQSIVQAIQLGKDDRAIKLLQKINSFNKSINQFGDTALHYAAHLGKLHLIEQLIKKGADTSIKNSEGLTPLDVASHNKQVDCVNLLMQYNAAKTQFFNQNYNK